MAQKTTDPTAWPDELVALYRAEYDGFVRLAYLMIGSTAVAEEVVQEAFVRVRGSWAHIRTSPGGYTRSAVLNGARAALRRLEVEDRLPPEPPPPGAPEDLVDLRDALLRLPWSQRCAIALRYWADLPEAETARLLDCRPATVRSHIARGLATLRKELS